ATDLFDASTVVSFAERFVRVLGAVVADPSVPVGDAAWLSPGEADVLIEDWQVAGARVDDDVTLVSLFESAAVEHAGRVAVRFEGRSVSYGELASRVRRLARHLMSLGVGPDSVVAVVLPRSEDLVVALLAVLEAGGAYLPIDPAYPAERIAFTLEDAAPVVVVSWSGRPAAVSSVVPVVEIDRVDVSALSDSPIVGGERRGVVRGANLAYVIYTSGSTGRPKGVQVAHGNVVALLANTVDRFGFDSSDVWTLFHSYAFDFSVWELWGALACGGTVVVVDYLTSRSPDVFVELVARERVTVLNQTPSAFYQFAEADRVAGAAAPVLSLRWVIFGGEALDPSRLSGWFARHGGVSPRLVNMYGITETTVHVSYVEVEASSACVGAASVVGRGLGGLRVYVLDDRLRPVPVGVPGQMYVSGGQLSRGYLGRAELTSGRFVADPFSSVPGVRMYRTGDVARWNRGGQLEYAGRSDLQVQLRGFRIELGEIEAALLRCEGVAQAVASVRRDEQLGDRLVGYVVPRAGAVVDPQGVVEAVGEFLTGYMVPDAVVVLGELPLTVNGKLDQRALPAPEFGQAVFRAPTTPVEQTVASVFAEVLGVERVGLDDDFFALGGNSLIATRVAARLGAALDAPVPVRVLFEVSSVQGLAARLESHVGEGGRAVLAVQRRPERVPLSLAQQRMWFLNRFDPESATYNIPVALRLTGSLDVAALQSAVEDVIARHEVLRTVYPEHDGAGYQHVLPAQDVVVDLTPRHVDATEIVGAVTDLFTRGFDVAAEVPVRAHLLEVTPAEHVLVLVVHHIATDGFSMGPLTRDVMVAYAARSAGAAPGWAPLDVQYADYAIWQRDVLGDENDP
ncbi:amino acid adenylation domain-containing protein, partial [Rhodococcus pyridinivorans]